MQKQVRAVARWARWSDPAQARLDHTTAHCHPRPKSPRTSGVSFGTRRGSLCLVQLLDAERAGETNVPRGGADVHLIVAWRDLPFLYVGVPIR